MPESREMSSHATKSIAEFKVGNATWRVESHCGVVRITNGNAYFGVMNSTEARHVAVELANALVEAADSVDRASRGEER